MIPEVFLAWILLCCRVSGRPLSSELGMEDEKVTRCIVEVISDTLSNPKPIPVSRDCSKILKEDERILAMVRHQNLLKELEELTHHEEVRESSGKKRFLDVGNWWNSPEEGGAELNGDDSVDKRDMLDKEGGGAGWRDEVSGRGGANTKKDNPSKREEDMKEYEDSKEAGEAERRKGKGVTNGEDDTKAVARGSEKEDSDEDKRSPEKRQREAAREESRRSKGQDERDDLRLDRLIKTIGEKELDDDKDDKRAGEQKHHSKENSSKEDDDLDKRNEEEQEKARKRVEENARDEQTDQFEAEENGVSRSDSQAQHSLEEQKRGADKRHQHLEEDMGLKKRHDEDPEHLRKRPNEFANSEEQEDDEEEDEEGEEEEEDRKLKREDQEQRNLAEIEEELKEVAEKLRDIRRG